MEWQKPVSFFKIQLSNINVLLITAWIFADKVALYKYVIYYYKSVYTQYVLFFFLSRATARVKRAYFGNKKIIPRAFHEISSPL